jgi:PAS domain S-box-containing protein
MFHPVIIFGMPVRSVISPEELNKMSRELSLMGKTFDVLDVHIIITDNMGNIVYANKAAADKTGYTIEEMLGKNPGDLWGGQESEEFYKKMWHTIKDEKKLFVGTVTNKNKDGSTFQQELHINPLVDEKGEVKYFVSMEPDVTLQSSYEQQLIEKSRQVSELINMLEQNHIR